MGAEETKRMKSKMRYIFCCIKCGKNWLSVPARGYWKTIKEWICEECKKS
jgi:hypothetical protein